MLGKIAYHLGPIGSVLGKDDSHPSEPYVKDIVRFEPYLSKICWPERLVLVCASQRILGKAMRKFIRQPLTETACLSIRQAVLERQYQGESSFAKWSRRPVSHLA